MGSYSWLNGWWGEPHKSNRPSEGAARSPLNRGHGEGPLVSFVLLLKAPRRLDESALASAVARAFECEGHAGGNETRSVAGESPYFLVHAAGRFFAVNDVPRPYFENTAAVAAELPDLRLRRAVARHHAWLSVDFLQADAGVRGDPYEAAGKLAAELAGPDCLAVCVPAKRRVFVYEESVPAKLRGPGPLEALRASPLVPVVGLAPDDPRLLAAVAEARRRWPEFVAAFEQRQPGQLFSVKVPVRDGKVTEYMWVSVSALENDMIYGRLDNEPMDVKRLKAGDHIRVPVADLNDWLYTCGDTLAGGFTIDVLGNASKRPRQH